MGDRTDNIPGANGIGETKSDKIVDELESLQFEEIIEYFDSEMDAMMNYWLVRMDQFDGKDVKLWQM